MKKNTLYLIGAVAGALLLLLAVLLLQLLKNRPNLMLSWLVLVLTKLLLLK